MFSVTKRAMPYARGQASLVRQPVDSTPETRELGDTTVASNANPNFNHREAHKPDIISPKNSVESSISGGHNPALPTPELLLPRASRNRAPPDRLEYSKLGG